LENLKKMAEVTDEMIYHVDGGGSGDLVQVNSALQFVQTLVHQTSASAPGDGLWNYSAVLASRDSQEELLVLISKSVQSRAAERAVLTCEEGIVDKYLAHFMTQNEGMSLCVQFRKAVTKYVNTSIMTTLLKIITIDI